MMPRLLFILGAVGLGATAAVAADNSLLPVAGGGTETFANKDITGVKFPKNIPYNSSGVELFTSGNAGFVQFGSAQAVTAAQSTAANLNATVVGTGTFAVQAAQSGTWNITNISGTVSLPTGASTAAKQPALGTAGSASTDVISVQGIASMTPILANPGTAANWGVGTSTQNSSTVANGQLALAQFNTTPTTITTGNMSPLQMDNAGNLLVNIKAGAGSGGTALADQATFTQSTTSETPMGCLFTNSYTTATSGKATIVSCTSAGSVHTTVDNVNANGQATMSNSSPVVIASNQSAVPISAASGAIASGAVASGAFASGSVASGALVDITNMSASTGAAPPSKVIYLGANAGGATGGHVAGLISCDGHVFKHITSATDTVAVQGVASQTIYICGWRSRAAGTATWYLENTASANNNCSSTLTQITGVASEVANSGETMLTPFWTGLKNTSGNGLCINSTGTGGVDIDIWFTQF